LEQGNPTKENVALYHQLVGIKNSNLVHKRSMVGMSVFAAGISGNYDPFVVERMPIDLQLGFRRKIFGILSFQTLIVNVFVGIMTFNYHTKLDGYFCPKNPDEWICEIEGQDELNKCYERDDQACASCAVNAVTGIYACEGERAIASPIMPKYTYCAPPFVPLFGLRL